MKRFPYLLFLLCLMAVGSLQAQPFNISATIPYEGETASGTYRIYRSSFSNNISLNQLRTPLVFVEGFDPSDFFGINNIYNILDFGFPSVADQLHSAGYDIIILNFDDGGDYIQRNAFLLVELINQINAQKPNNDEIVVVGFSMGGLVSRYALTYMEEQAIDHEARLFVSFDSPQKGAHVPVGIQALATTFDAEFYLQLFPDLAESLAQFTAPAAQQMLLYRIDSPTEASGEIPLSVDHVAFMDEINTLNDCNGYPTETRNVAVSLGSWNSIPQLSNLDLDNDGNDDFQHSGFPMLYINIPQGGGDDEPQAIWELNTCEAIAAFAFQIFFSTAFSTDYPYYDDRSSYGDLGEWVYATYWYRNSNSPLGLLFPQGAWSRFWTYETNEPTDFAPGAFVPAYDDILDAINSQVECSFGYADNSTFVPTVSALAFDTDDAFYDIEADAARLDKTPFDNIIGITGDNTSHRAGQTSNTTIVNWIVDEITNDYGSTCATGLKALMGTVNSGQTVLEDETDRIEAANYTVKSGANVSLEAQSSITFLPGLVVEAGSNFTAEIVPCSAKPCAWEPEEDGFRKPGGGVEMLMANQSTDELNSQHAPRMINTNPRAEKTKTAEQQMLEEMAQAFPNPTEGSFVILSRIEGAQVEIINSLGEVVYRNDYLELGPNAVTLDVPSGVYHVLMINQGKYIWQEKIVKQ